MTTTYLDNLASVNARLSQPWGTVATNGQVTQFICPLCQAIVPASFTNQHELTKTPKDAHGDNHRAIASAFEALNRAANATKAEDAVGGVGMEEGQ